AGRKALRQQQRRRAPAALEIRERGVDGLHLRVRAVDGNARLQLRPHVERLVAVGWIHYERPVEVELTIEDAEDPEGGRQDADDRTWRAVHGDRASDDGGIAVEEAPPETVAQDHHVVPAGLRRVVVK